VPLLSAGNWGALHLHLRGNIEGWRRAASAHVLPARWRPARRNVPREQWRRLPARPALPAPVLHGPAPVRRHARPLRGLGRVRRARAEGIAAENAQWASDRADEAEYAGWAANHAIRAHLGDWFFGVVLGLGLITLLVCWLFMTYH